MDSYADFLSGLYYFRLGLIKKSKYTYALYDLDTYDMYEDMSIYYIRSLIREWTNKRTK